MFPVQIVLGLSQQTQFDICHTKMLQKHDDVVTASNWMLYDIGNTAPKYWMYLDRGFRSRRVCQIAMKMAKGKNFNCFMLRHFVNFKYEIWCIILELEYQ